MFFLLFVCFICIYTLVISYIFFFIYFSAFFHLYIYSSLILSLHFHIHPSLSTYPPDTLQRFIDEETFLDRRFHLLLFALHLTTLSAFFYFYWIRYYSYNDIANSNNNFDNIMVKDNIVDNVDWVIFIFNGVIVNQ